MRRFLPGWKQLEYERRLRAYVVNYAGKLKLTVNETKTRVCKLPEEKFEFLGYTFGRCYSPKSGRPFLGTVPSKKRVKRICNASGRNTTLLDAEIVVKKLNRMLNGWATTSAWVRSVRPTGRKSTTPVRGFDSGCAPNTRYADWAPVGFRASTSTMRYVWSALPRGPAAFRVRNREAFSGSRMR